MPLLHKARTAKPVTKRSADSTLQDSPPETIPDVPVIPAEYGLHHTIAGYCCPSIPEPVWHPLPVTLPQQPAGTCSSLHKLRKYDPPQRRCGTVSHRSCPAEVLQTGSDELRPHIVCPESDGVFHPPQHREAQSGLPAILPVYGWQGLRILLRCAAR